METTFGDARLPSRFWEKVEIDSLSGCWEWTASKNERGYGIFGTRSNGLWRNMKAHRIAHMTFNGDIPDHVLVDHRCLKHSCVNPQHLRLATTKQNQENLAYAEPVNTSGIRGVSWASRNQKWLAKVTHNQKQVYVGLFRSIAEAEIAVIAKRNELFTHNELDRLATA